MGRMSAPATSIESAIRDALATVQDPEIHRPITELDMVESVTVDARGAVRLGILLTVAGCPLRDKLRTDITAAVGTVDGVRDVEIDFGVMTPEQRKNLQTSLRGNAQVHLALSPGHDLMRLRIVHHADRGILVD